MNPRGSRIVLAAFALTLSTRAHADAETHPYLLVRAAATHRRLVDIPIYAAEFEIGAGFRRASFGQSVSTQILRGRTEAGLVTWGVDVAYRPEWYVGTRAWLGLSGEIGALWFKRVSADNTLSSGGFGGALRAGYDVIVDDVLRGGPELAFDAMAYGKTIAWGPTLGLRLTLIGLPRPRRPRALPQHRDEPSEPPESPRRRRWR